MRNITPDGAGVDETPRYLGDLPEATSTQLAHGALASAAGEKPSIEEVMVELRKAVTI